MTPEGSCLPPLDGWTLLGPQNGSSHHLEPPALYTLNSAVCEFQISHKPTVVAGPYFKRGDPWAEEGISSSWLWAFPGSLKTSCGAATQNALLKSPLDGHIQEHQGPPLSLWKYSALWVPRKRLHFRWGIWVLRGGHHPGSAVPTFFYCYHLNC